MSRFAYIYNPAARSGKARRELRNLKNHIKKQPHADFYRSEKKGDIAPLVDNLLPDYDVFVACGGDGTVREVAENLVESDKTLGIIPLGTGNDLSKTLKIPADPEKSLELIERQKSTSIDVGKCENILFLNSLGFGFDGLTNRMAFEMQALPPVLRYATAALRAAVKQDPFEVTIEQEGGSTGNKLLMISFANGRIEGGSFWIAPRASITDGKLEMVTISPLNKWLIPFLLPLFLFRKGDWIPHVSSKPVSSVLLDFKQEVEIHADGEIIQMDRKTFSVKVIPRALKVICGL